MTKRPDPDAMTREQAIRIAVREIGIDPAALATVSTPRVLMLALSASLISCRRDLSAARCRLLHAKSRGRRHAD